MLLGGTSGHLEMVDQQNANMVHCLRIDSQRSSPKALQPMLPLGRLSLTNASSTVWTIIPNSDALVCWEISNLTFWLMHQRGLHTGIFFISTGVFFHTATSCTKQEIFWQPLTTRSTKIAHRRSPMANQYSKGTTSKDQTDGGSFQLKR
ncbi:hypothetical protein HOLleu_22787 [Holothuria leucospilota]|uniref:Uncharacterized protein n=1 Tax=Holothuria leucospilota TaxID=206669 RepID=A0A9Q1BU76_HOLLE|nr:hypothetical protein HOLleu_22787 [Holothuria leucospilota]